MQHVVRKLAGSKTVVVLSKGAGTREEESNKG